MIVAALQLYSFTWQIAMDKSDLQTKSHAAAQRDFKSLLLLVTIASVILFGVGLSSIVRVSTRDTGLLTRNLGNW